MARASLLSCPLIELWPPCFLNFSFLFVFWLLREAGGWRDVQLSSCTLVALPSRAGNSPSSAVQADLHCPGLVGTWSLGSPVTAAKLE